MDTSLFQITRQLQLEGCVPEVLQDFIRSDELGQQLASKAFGEGYMLGGQVYQFPFLERC